MAAFGIDIQGSEGWICRECYKGGEFWDFGGFGYTKQQAIDALVKCHEWLHPRSDWESTQLFPIRSRKKEHRGTLVVAFDDVRAREWEIGMRDSHN